MARRCLAAVLFLCMLCPQIAQAGGRSPGAARPWVVRRVLDVQGAGHLCSAHPSANFIASVRGYLVTTGLNGPAGGWVGRLFVRPNPHAFFAGDTHAFVEVWGTIRWSVPENHVAIVHGTLACDAAENISNLPGWRASIRPNHVSRG